MPATISSNHADTSSSYWEENYTQPYFDNTTKRDITVTIGLTALLNCKVRNLGDRAVSDPGLEATKTTLIYFLCVFLSSVSLFLHSHQSFVLNNNEKKRSHGLEKGEEGRRKENDDESTFLHKKHHHNAYYMYFLFYLLYLETYTL